MKITIKALKQSGIYREPLLHLRNSVRQTFRVARQWRRVCSTRHLHWRRVGSLAVAKKTSSRGRSETASSLLLSWPAVTYKTIKKRNQQFCLVQIRSRIFFLF